MLAGALVTFQGDSCEMRFGSVVILPWMGERRHVLGTLLRALRGDCGGAGIGASSGSTGKVAGCFGGLWARWWKCEQVFAGGLRRAVGGSDVGGLATLEGLG